MEHRHALDPHAGLEPGLSAAAMDAAFLAPLKPVTRLALGTSYGLSPCAIERARDILRRMPDGTAHAATDAQRRDFLLVSGWTPWR